MTGSQPHSRPVLTEDLWQILFTQAFLFATKYINRLRWRGTFGGVLPDGDDAESIAAQAVTDFLLSHPGCVIRHCPLIHQSNNPLIQPSSNPSLPRSTSSSLSRLEYKSWPHPRRLILIRHRVEELQDTRAGKKLLDVSGYRFQALVTSLPVATHPPLSVWRYYNGRADCENVIKELREGFALPTICLDSFWATEAALVLATLTYNLTVLFQRHLGWQTKVTIHSLRFWLFITAGVLSYPRGKTTIKLAMPAKERDWWCRLWEKIGSPFTNCNAVENRPVFTS